MAAESRHRNVELRLAGWGSRARLVELAAFEDFGAEHVPGRLVGGGIGDAGEDEDGGRISVVGADSLEAEGTEVGVV